MKIIEKISEKNSNMYGAKPITIAFIGDSVTHGCFEVYYKRDGQLETVYEADHAYSAHLKRMLNYLYPTAQINIINSGISGDSAPNGDKRFDRDIAPFSPDLVVIGYALNDSGKGADGLKIFEDALISLVNKVKAIGAECILLTPNMMNDKVSPHIEDERIITLARRFMTVDLERYVEVIKKVADKTGTALCDVYSRWKLMKEGGVDITELLSNKLNHPNRELHYLTAYKLIETMFEK